MYMYGNRTEKPAQIVLSRVKGDMRRDGVNLIREHCMCVWKYHNETPLYTYMLINNV
jgi:hypothetical protein